MKTSKCIAAFSSGGLIQGAFQTDDLEEAIEWLKEQVIKDGFDNEADDLRIFIFEPETKESFDEATPSEETIDGWLKERDHRLAVGI